jgi:ubiquinone/menaquinone biosynthesis C-methylase UbiE
MEHNNENVLNYWNQPEVESMYDKYLLNAEIEMIRSRIIPNSKILDAGCGEGEGTLEYSKIEGTEIHAADFSDVRLEKAKERLAGRTNIRLYKIDFLEPFSLDNDYDFIISQRFIINLMQWALQKKVILDFASRLKPGGKLLLLEGSRDGVLELNAFRASLGLEPIAIKWHNLFLENRKMEHFLNDNGLRVLEKDGLGEYFLLTRGIRPFFDKNLSWDNTFNKITSGETIRSLLNLKDRFSRLALWVIQKF